MKWQVFADDRRIGMCYQSVDKPQFCVKQNWGLLYQENHALDAWFKKAYGDEEKPCYNNWAVCQLQQLK